ncbi:hypothetical protein BC567DRAFT_225983 [Phyllosticta citribraziliensis]
MSFCSRMLCFAFLVSTKTFNPFWNCAIFCRGRSRRVSGLSLSTTAVTGPWVRARLVQSVCTETTAPVEIPPQWLTSRPVRSHHPGLRQQSVSLRPEQKISIQKCLPLDASQESVCKDRPHCCSLMSLWWVDAACTRQN